MERIFSERKSLGGDGRANALAAVEAWYDATVSVFVMDCDVEGAASTAAWAPDPMRHMRTIENQAEAVRAAVLLADTWYAAVDACLPVLPPEPPNPARPGIQRDSGM